MYRRDPNELAKSVCGSLWSDSPHVDIHRFLVLSGVLVHLAVAFSIPDRNAFQTSHTLSQVNMQIRVRAVVAGQRGSPESRFVNKTEMF